MRGRFLHLVSLLVVTSARGQQLSPELTVSNPLPIVRAPNATFGAAFDGGLVLVSSDTSSPTFGPRAVFLEADGGLGGRSPLGVPLETTLTTVTAPADVACGDSVCAVLLREASGGYWLRRFTFGGLPVDAARINLGVSGFGGRLAFSGDVARVLVESASGVQALTVTGTTVDPGFLVSPAIVGQLAFACLAGGSCLAAWQGSSSIRARGFTPTGPLGPEFTVSNQAWNPAWTEVAAGAGRFLVAWRPGYGELRLRTWNATIASPSPEQVLRTAAVGEIDPPIVGWTGTRFRAVWSEGITRSTWTRDFDELGTPLTMERQVFPGRTVMGVVTPTSVVRLESPTPTLWVFDQSGARLLVGAAPASSRSVGGFATPAGLGAATMATTANVEVGLLDVAWLQGASLSLRQPLGSANLSAAGVACEGTLCLAAWPGQRDAGFALHLQRFNATGLVDVVPRVITTETASEVRVAVAPGGFLVAGASGSDLWTQPLSSTLAPGPRRTVDVGTSAFQPGISPPTRGGFSLASGKVDYDPPIRSLAAIVPPTGLTPLGVEDIAARFEPVRAAAHQDVFLVPANGAGGLVVEVRRVDGGVTLLGVSSASANDSAAASDGTTALVVWVSAAGGTRTLLARGFDAALQPLAIAFQVAAADNISGLGVTPLGQARFLVTYDAYDPPAGVFRSRARLVALSTAGVLLAGAPCSSDGQCLSNRCASSVCLALGDGGTPGPTPVDGGATDGGGLPGDAGSPDAGPLDAGAVTPDGGLADGGGAPDGGGLPLVDGGVDDGGASTSTDAGPGVDDAGSSNDAGVEEDAGLPSDAGLAHTGSNGEPRSLGVGCACQSVEPALMAAFLALWVARRRRRGGH
ncbi:MAG: MYXO-CTERM sorting domain-containing protein [Myxococcaceae bacterium]|nr:MYXO-CTERM sorting domain-containing protein [Myxococcaceae bacterium]